MPTQKQKAWYWREWSAAVKAAKAAGLPPPDRHAITKQAIGREKSMLDLDNRELDLVIAAFRAISDPDNLDAQLRQQMQPRIRLEYKLTVDLTTQLAQVIPGHDDAPAADRLTAAEHYILAIARDKFGTDCLPDLTDAQLQLLCMDTTRAVQRFRNSSQHRHELAA